MGQFHRLKHSVNDEGRTQARSQAEKKHSSTPITAQRLHRRVVNDLYGETERFSEIETDPSPAQVVRFGHRMSVDHRTGIADGDGIVFPAGGRRPYLSDHSLRCHRRAGIDLKMLPAPCRQHFHVGAADVNGQDFHSS